MNLLTSLALLLSCDLTLSAQRNEILLEKGWKFHLGDAPGAQTPDYDDSAWDSVCVPHDWAITGPFSIANDLQRVAVTQNFETEATLKTGRTGGLPYVGVGWYRCAFDVPEGRQAELLFDGAMSEAVRFEKGELKAVAYDADGKDLCYLTVRVVDKDGNICPFTAQWSACRSDNIRPFELRWFMLYF